MLAVFITEGHFLTHQAEAYDEKDSMLFIEAAKNRLDKLLKVKKTDARMYIVA